MFENIFLKLCRFENLCIINLYEICKIWGKVNEKKSKTKTIGDIEHKIGDLNTIIYNTINYIIYITINNIYK